VAVVTLAVVVPDEDVVGKKYVACCNRDVGVPEVDVFGKQDGAVRIGSRRWPQDCQTCGLVEENGGTPPVS